jgi:prepilin-type N-terminal cleavage/methylation domain-containing protein
MMQRAQDHDRGFTLIEVLVASALLIVGVLSVARLFVLVLATNVSAQRETQAVILAIQKIEELRSLEWAYDIAGAPLSDTITGGVGLTPSPPGALDDDIAGYVDYADRFGRILNGARPPGAGYVRRWSITPLPLDPDNTIVIHVRVTDLRAAAGRTGSRQPGDVRLATVRTRKEG